MPLSRLLMPWAASNAFFRQKPRYGASPGWRVPVLQVHRERTALGGHVQESLSRFRRCCARWAEVLLVAVQMAATARSAYVCRNEAAKSG